MGLRIVYGVSGTGKSSYIFSEISRKIKEDKNKKIAKIILILMGVILVVIIGLIGAMAYIKSSELQIYLNGSANTKIKEMMVIEDDGTIYSNKRNSIIPWL